MASGAARPIPGAALGDHAAVPVNRIVAHALS
jgi:hypothetical protein